MVENVIEVVEFAANRISRVDRKAFIVFGKKALPRITEKFHHRQIGFMVTKVTGWIVDYRIALRVGRLVATPQVAMQQRRSRIVVIEKKIQLPGQPITRIN